MYGKFMEEKREPFESSGIDSESCIQTLLFNDGSLSSLLKFAQQKGADKSDLILKIMII